MKIKGVSEIELRQALELVNKRFDGNVEFNNFQKEGNSYRVTLRVKDSHKKGSRLSYAYLTYGAKRGIAHHLISACWHVHGYFFEALLSINENAVIVSANRTITKEGGNWEDWNIGSMICPMYYSDACECNQTA